MIGARHSAGSIISNGGDSSPSNCIIVGDPLLGLARCASDRALQFCALSVIATTLPSKKFESCGNVCGKAIRRVVLIFAGFRSRNNFLPSPEIYPLLA